MAQCVLWGFILSWSHQLVHHDGKENWPELGSWGIPPLHGRMEEETLDIFTYWECPSRKAANQRTMQGWRDVAFQGGWCCGQSDRIPLWSHQKISSAHSFLGPSYQAVCATTGASSKANNFQIIFGIASGSGAFFYFNDPKCHVRFPRCN